MSSSKIKKNHNKRYMRFKKVNKKPNVIEFFSLLTKIVTAPLKNIQNKSNKKKQETNISISTLALAKASPIKGTIYNKKTIPVIDVIPINLIYSIVIAITAVIARLFARITAVDIYNLITPWKNHDIFDKVSLNSKIQYLENLQPGLSKKMLENNPNLVENIAETYIPIVENRLDNLTPLINELKNLSTETVKDCHYSGLDMEVGRLIAEQIILNTTTNPERAISIIDNAIIIGTYGLSIMTFWANRLDLVKHSDPSILPPYYFLMVGFSGFYLIYLIYGKYSNQEKIRELKNETIEKKLELLSKEEQIKKYQEAAKIIEEGPMDL